ncbi:flavin monoamine oxidase family protein [Chitinimonas sp. BJB300]|uniref:flavin monoamine oxidase family protein n=1 Tax=Chitinimonas sp. BJB300 TaxID=1559339 RepID=UPI000C10ED1F|nr:FAD-dependent oxidoreductase [Chitinimonas sp. BJB300]PHV11692.1 amine oxidase [Chitinimonas sp. BJB300]TSJ88591.1 FAD-dependent oxidoreductase [Chitinimonas sp. BJB300]
MASETMDIAIVGGGISGVYSAWRLKKSDTSKKIVVFEGSDHIGGRLLSVQPPDIPNMVAELGGMRILPAVQPLITALIDELNQALPAEEKIELYDFPVDQPQNLAYLRGVYLRLSDFTNEPDKVPYQLSFLDHGSTAGGIILSAIEQIVPGITSPNLTEEQRRTMAQEASFGGVPLYQQGFWNVLLRVINSEAYQLSIDAGGYDSTLSNWNAADAIPWYLSDFGVDAKYKGFCKGFQEVPKSVAQLFQNAGGEVRLNATVSSIKWDNGAFEFTADGKIIRAKQLILAMPRRSIDILATTSPLLMEFQQLTASVTPRPLFKLFTTYSNPWWKAAGYTDADGKYVPVLAGRSVTDIPVRQTYYWPLSDGQPAESGRAMLLASYDDGSNTGFWDGLRPQRHQARRGSLRPAPVADPFIGDAIGKLTESTWHQYTAPRLMVGEVSRQLGLMHGLNYTPEVLNAAFRDWGDDPFGGGWNSWNIGVKSWEVKQRIIKPMDVCPLYICGEAYSDAQGWVEGALQTADMMLKAFKQT